MSKTSLLVAGKAAALAMLMGTAAHAQAVVDTPEGNTVTVPAEAVNGQDPIETAVEPTEAQAANDLAITETLTEQGYSDIEISRAGPTLSVTAIRGEEAIELVYSTATGQLVSVDGVAIASADDGMAAGAPAVPMGMVMDNTVPEADGREGGDDLVGGTDVGGIDTPGTIPEIGVPAAAADGRETDPQGETILPVEGEPTPDADSVVPADTDGQG